jgi:hypothetical protein
MSEKEKRYKNLVFAYFKSSLGPQLRSLIASPFLCLKKITLYMADYYALMNEKGKIRLVEIFPGMGIKENDGWLWTPPEDFLLPLDRRDRMGWWTQMSPCCG